MCVPDFLRGANGYPEVYFDLVRESIRQGANVNIGYPAGGKRLHGLNPSFKLSEFRARAGMTAEIFADGMARQLQWSATYHKLADCAIDYLFDHLPSDHLLLSFDIPPWLAQACIERNVEFLDIRPSPLRFGRDLCIALRCTSETLFNRIGMHSVCEEELRLEAGILSANIRFHKTRLESERGFTFDNLDGALLFLGQTPTDASRLLPNGHSLRCTDFADELREFCRGRRLLHKAHPFALEFAQEERAALKYITGQTPESCQQNAYQILSSEDDVTLAGISSGMLQEAVWFDKTAHLLYQPFVPLAYPDATKTTDAYYQQIHFQTFLSPAFWHQILAPEQPAPRLAKLPPVAHNHARETFDHWWDYSKVMTWERTLTYESFMRGGGAALRQRIETLEKKSEAFFSFNHIQGHDFSLHSGERQVATRYDDIRADHRFRYEWVDARLPDGGAGIDSFCGNGYGTWRLAQKRHVWGIDGSIEAIRLAEQHYKTPTAFFSQSFYPFELPCEQFDFAVSLESIEHVEDGAGFFACLVKSLKPGGLLFFSTPCEERLPHAQLSDDFHFHYKHYTFEEATNLALEHGLEIIDWAGQDVYSFLPDGKPTLLPDHAAMQLKKGTIGQFLIFCCRKKDTQEL